jgi:hypothetical protein
VIPVTCPMTVTVAPCSCGVERPSGGVVIEALAVS